MTWRGPFLILAVIFSLAPAAAQERVTVAAQRIAGNGPLFMAMARNHFKAEGLTVEIKFYPAALSGANALAAGQADLAAIELTAPVLSIAGRGTIKAIAGQASEKKDYEGNSLVASNAAWAGGLKDFQNLGGRSVAITQLGTVYQYQAAQIARAKGFDPSSLTFKSFQTVEAVTSAVGAGQADAAILPSDAARTTGSLAQGKVIGWVSNVAEAQLGALFASAAMIETRRSTVEKFVRAYQRGANDYAATLLRRDRYLKRVVDATAHDAALAMAPFLYPSSDPQRAALAFEQTVPYADPQARLDVAGFLELFAWFKARGLLESAAEPRKALDLSFIKAHLNAPQ